MMERRGFLGSLVSVLGVGAVEIEPTPLIDEIRKQENNRNSELLKLADRGLISYTTACSGVLCPGTLPNFSKDTDYFMSGVPITFIRYEE